MYYFYNLKKIYFEKKISLSVTFPMVIQQNKAE